MTGSASSRRRFGAGAIAAAFAILALAPAAVASPSTGRSTQGQAGNARANSPVAPPTRLTLTSVRPLAPQPGDNLVITGTITNVSAAVISHIDLLLYVDNIPFGLRKQLDAYASQPATTSFDQDPNMAAQFSATTQPANFTLGPRASTPWSVTVPIASLGLTQPWRVYPVGVAAVTADNADAAVGRLRTLLPYAPDGEGTGGPLHVSWIWPLVDVPHRNVIGTSEVFTDDDLATSFATGGRLSRLIQAAKAAAGQHTRPRRHITIRHKHKTIHRLGPKPPVERPVDVTYAVDPMLIEDAQLMSAGYTVHTGGKTQAGTGKAAASSWLQALTKVVPTGEVLSLPYADPDVVAAVRSHEAALVRLASTAGQVLVSRALGATLGGWALPPNGFANASTLAHLYRAGVSDVVLNSTEVTATAQEPSTLTTPHVTLATRAGDMSGIVSDQTLSRVVDAGAAAGQSGAALQRYLAETLMIQAGDAGAEGSVVIAPNQRWDPSAAYATALLDDTGRVPWLRPAPLSEAAQAPAQGQPIHQLNYPRAATADELPQNYVHEVGQVAGEVDELSGILSPGSAMVRDYDEAIWQALSSAWRGNVGAAEDFRHELSSTVASTISQVYIASRPRSQVTLTSHSGAIPITVANNLDFPVHVRVLLDAPYLTLTQESQQVRTIPPHDRVAVDVKATAKTSGRSPLNVQLLEPDRHPFGSPVRLYVRSTAYGTVALVITGAALGILLAAVGTRLVRRGIRARRAGGGEQVGSAAVEAPAHQPHG